MKQYIKDFYKKEWGIISREDPDLMGMYDAEDAYGARTVRCVAMEKDFSFRIAGNSTEGWNGTSGKTKDNGKPPLV